MLRESATPLTRLRQSLEVKLPPTLRLRLFLGVFPVSGCVKAIAAALPTLYALRAFLGAFIFRGFLAAFISVYSQMLEKKK